MASQTQTNEIIYPPPNSDASVKMSPNEVISPENNFSGVGRKMATLVMPQRISKCERYDDDILQQMLIDENISMGDRKRLSDYHKHARIAPSKASITYERAKNCSDAQLGRYYPVGVGLQSFRWDIRGPLTAKYYWDIDLENAHYNIALKYARDYGIRHESLEKYCKKRDECLKLFSDDRATAKNAFLKVLYNGDLSLAKEGAEDKGGQCKPEGVAFYHALKAEVDTLAEMMWGRHTHLHKHKCGKENKAIEKRANHKAVLMSLVFQTEEAKCMVVLDQFLSQKNRTVGILIHDGVNVEKVDGELKFPTELLVEGAKEIQQVLGYSFTITQKDIKNTYEAPPKSANAYAKMKADFEKRWFLIGATLNQICDDGTRLEHKMAEAKVICANMMVNVLDPVKMTMKKVPFLTEWIADPNRADYQRCDFIPNREACPEKVFNLFTGFQIEEDVKEELAENGAIDEKEQEVLIEPILKHLRVLCGSEDIDYALRWLANLFQRPDMKSDVGLFFRDMGGLLYEGGGTGKNLFWEWLGKRLLGEKYYITVDDNSTLYGSFNSVFEGKLLTFVEEANGKDNHSNIDKLKSNITKKSRTVNRKMMAQYESRDYARYIFGSNNRNPLPIKQGDRRFAMWDVDTTYRGDKAYFDALVEAMETRRVCVAFFQYLMAYPTWTKPIDFQVNRPITTAYMDCRQMNAPAHMKWLRHELRRGTLPAESSSSALYQRFRDWYASGNRDGERVMSEIAFGRLMNEAYEELPLGESSHTMKGTIRKFDFRRLIDGMIKLHLLEEGEASIGADGLLIQMETE